MIRLPFTCKCEECPLYKGGAGRVATLIDREGDIDVLFVGEAPGTVEVQRGMPFVGPSGDLIRSLVAERFSGVVAFGNVVRCQPSGGNNEKALIKEAGKFCVPNLERDIKRLKPRIVAILGSTALSLLFPEKKLNDSKGTFWEKDGITYTVTYHPAAILRNHTMLGSVASDLDSIAFYLATGHPSPEVSKMPDLETLEYEVLDTVEKIEEYIDYLNPSSVLALDTETSFTGWKFVRVFTIQIYDGKRPVLIPLATKFHVWTPEEYSRVISLLHHLFFEKKVRAWIMHNAKYDLTVLRAQFDSPARWGAPVYDTMMGAYLLDENRVRWGGYSLYSLALENLNVDSPRWKAGKDQRSDIENQSKEDFYWYSVVDAVITWHLFSALRFKAQLQKYKKKWLGLLRDLYSPVLQAYAEIQYTGIKVDMEKLMHLGAEDGPIISRMNEVLQELKESENVQKANDILMKEKKISNFMFGKPFLWDITKRKHLEILFFDVMNLDPVTYTEKGLAQINDTFYREYESIKEAQLVKKWFQLRKMLTSYVDQFLDLMTKEDHKDGRIRPEYGFMTVTGRTKSYNPNIQQMPRSDKEGAKDFKRVFIPEPGNVIVQLDYKANESRWWCILSQDKKMSALFNKGFSYIQEIMGMDNPPEELIEKAKLEGDIHRQTASRMWNIASVSDVPKDLRQQAKTINFGWMYGRSVKSIAEQLKESQWDHEKESWDDFVSRVGESCRYFDKEFKEASEWLHACEESVKANYWVESPIGRRRRLWGAFLGDKREKAEALRQSRNSPIQSIASDATLIGVALLHQFIIDHKRNWKILATVHDSTVVEVPKEEVREYLYSAWDIYTKGVMDYMTEKWGLPFPISLEVDFEIGQPPDFSWGNMAKWDMSKPALEKILENLK